MILRFIDYRYGKELDLDNKYCALEIDSFKGFLQLYKSGFDEKTSRLPEVVDTDDLNQIPHYMQLWEVIKKYSLDGMSSRLRNKDTCQSLLENIKKAELNVIINTSGKNAHGIKFFLDVNLKGKKLDTEDVFKSYLFYYDSCSDIRNLWVRIKKFSSKLTVINGKKVKSLYPLMEIIRHSFYCNLYKHKKWKSIEISNEFSLSKGVEIPGDIENESAYHYRGEHIIDTLKDRTFMKKILSDVESFLMMAIDVYENKSPSSTFIALFNVEEKDSVDLVTISIAHAFIRRILFDDYVLPKSILFKYHITTLSQMQKNKNAYKWIFDVYCFDVLFNLSAIKKQKEMVLNIVSEKNEKSDWHVELSKTIQTFLEDSELSRAKVALQYKYSDDEFNEECLSRGLAVLYNFITVQSGRCSVGNERELNSFLTNTEKYSLEHFVINQSKKYELSKNTFYSVKGGAGKCVNSMFNFIFISEDINNKLGNKNIREKMSILADKQIDCGFSNKVMEYINQYFINELSEVHNLHLSRRIFPEFNHEVSDDEKKYMLDEYFDDEKEYFLNTFAAYSSAVLKEVYKKISNL